MYYEESTNLIFSEPRYKTSIITLDRLIAHAYSADHLGYVELTLLARHAAEQPTTVDRFMRLYEAAGIVRRYEKMACSCGEKYDPNDGSCLSCGASLSDALPNGQICYAVQRVPQKPAFDPKNQPANPDVFISYRHSDSAVLATDLFYMLESFGKSVFLDDSSIAPGDDAEQIFLHAASRTAHFICLASRSYLDSEFCKKEIAHAARTGRRLIRINIAPSPSIPPDMPWVDGPNWLQEKGNEAGLEQPLERAILAALGTAPSGGMDLRSQACQYLMDSYSMGDLQSLWNRLPWLYQKFEMTNSRAGNIGIVLKEATGGRLVELCNALAP